MNNILFEVWVKDRLLFSDRDKRECFETARAIVDTAGEVRKHGLLYMDDKIPAMSDKFMARGMQLAVDSTDPETLRGIMQTWIIYGNYSGAELLRRIIATEGVISIVNGENPLQIKSRLAAYFGEDLYDEYWDDETKDILPEFYASLNDAPAESSSEFEKIIRSMDNLAMQVLIRNSEEHVILLALKNSSKQVAESFFGNMSRRAAEKIAHEYIGLRNVRARDVTAAQDKILEKIKVLEQRGEIVVAKDK